MTLSEAKDYLINNNYIIEKSSNASYGDMKVSFKPTGADGLWPGKYDLICKAIINNDVNTLTNYMNNGIPTSNTDNESGISFQDEYDEEFKRDYSLIFNGKYIDDALKFMLEYDSEFFIAPFDMMNLWHAGKKGCTPNTLRRLIQNYIWNTESVYDEAFDDMTWDEVLQLIPVDESSLIE